MEPPDKLDKCLAILVLRAVGLHEPPAATKKVLSSQEGVASMLGLGKPKVVATEKWFRGSSYKAAAVECEDEAIKSVTEGLLVDLEGMTAELMKKARQITQKDILRNFRPDYIENNVNFTFRSKLQEHWNNLAIAARGLATNTRLVFNTKGYIMGDITSGYIYTSGVFDSEEQTPLNKVSKTHAMYLLPHLCVEFPEFETIIDWRRLTAQDISERISKGMLDNLNLLSQRTSFLGTCEVCESWK